MGGAGRVGGAVSGSLNGRSRQSGRGSVREFDVVRMV